MRYYSNTYNWVKAGFAAFAVMIVVASLFVLNAFVDRLSDMETRRVSNWAEATRVIAKADENADLTLELKVINDNTDIPVILADSAGNFLDARNIDVPDDARERAEWTKATIRKFGQAREPIEIEMDDESHQYVYYDESMMVVGLRLFTIGALSIIFIFIVVLVLFLYSTWKSEQNAVWAGMSKETAHQLGTPISSLEAWMELFKLRDPSHGEYVGEMGKDVNRLKIIAERFSKIGSTPELNEESILPVVSNAVSYMRDRTSKRVDISLVSHIGEDYKMPLNVPLFEWVIENLCKNAVDSMGGKSGKIVVEVNADRDFCEIDVTDTGSGIPKYKWNTIFKSGYTTKKRGWGLGLSFAKRIIEEYHDGKIYVKDSEDGKGTTFAIVLFRNKKRRGVWLNRIFMKKIIK
ncbi:MAG: HAMP domain-containing histidine kinase [Paludibacteraceae bacterium]|nr:HAMP domain-containing histidine kinase [Paludibacteraceae bacterium]